MPANSSTPQRPWLLTWENVEGLIAIGAFRHPFPVGRQAVLQYDGEFLSLEIELLQGEPHHDLNLLPEALRFEYGTEPRNIKVRCLDTQLNKHFYMYVCETLELVREGGQSPTDALRVAWDRFGEFIQQQTILSHEKQVGLLGELTFLVTLASINEIGWANALEAWHQNARAEHDFSLTRSDFEVKTTTRERREHVIGSLDQLRENPERTLSLVSYHLTHAPHNADGSLCLAELVTQIIGMLAAHPALRDKFILRLGMAEWRESHNHLYTARYVRRNTPTIITIDERFPRLTREALLHLPEEARLRITSVIYRVDVSDLGEPLTHSTILRMER